jgi:transcriptional regulator with XRE-family HTH domain
MRTENKVTVKNSTLRNVTIKNGSATKNESVKNEALEKNVIGELVKNMREKKELTGYALAKHVGIHPSILYNLEKGKRGVGIDNLLAIANALDCDVALVERHPDMPVSSRSKKREAFHIASDPLSYEVKKQTL